jgi:hypothetical protein
MQRVYVSLKKETGHQWGLHSTLIVVLGFLVFVLITFFTKGAFNENREELLETLRKGSDVTALNEKLKVDLSSITRGRYIELNAKERLNLKRPKDGEVIILR